MARIRTIKPEFFTSEDIVSLSPLARLFYVSLWCEADREGRFEWKPRTFKMRYLPADECDVEVLGQELFDAGIVELYEVNGRTYAWIPRFTTHQVINNREAESTIPSPESSRVKVASARVLGEGRKEGKEGKGKEGEAPQSDANKRGARLPQDWSLPKSWGEWALSEFQNLTADAVRIEAEKFRDFWTAKAGKDAAKMDWQATWRNWCRNSRTMTANQDPGDQARSAKFVGGV